MADDNDQTAAAVQTADPDQAREQGHVRPTRRRGRPPLPRDDADRVQIVEMTLRGRSAAAIAADTGWSLDEVVAVRRQYLPTTNLAGHYLKAKALQLARRIVEEATVEEAIDVLTRPNIGVLEPVKKAGPHTGFWTSVTFDSLGAVQVKEADRNG